MTGEPLTERLVAVALDACDPQTARAAGGRALFDHLACRTAGRRVAPAGVGDAAAAALLDRDDLHWPSLTHPGAIVWTVVLATGAEGDERWRAAAAGYEVTARLGRALGPDHRRHWHATATAGTVGGAVAAALGLGADPVAAAGHAISVAGGSIVALLERSGTRALHRDHAAQTAIRCARATALPATRLGLEHPRGLFAATGGDPDLLLAPAPPAIAETTFRRHGTNGFCQALVEAAAEVAGPPPGGPVDVEVPEAVLALASDPRPRDDEAAWWSAEHAVAATLLGRDPGEPGLHADPDVAALTGRVRLRAGPVARVTVDGRTAERAEAAPLADDDLVAKWRRLNPDDPPPVHLLETEGERA
ncbi:MAG: MmgE/PrpD family protein [Solirubrobacteraceae bacterium]|nr:MmgE/PrpD family protein [Solirubrobacteraceae bacterium]